MQGTFINCVKITNAPLIPNSVSNIKVVYKGCESLEEVQLIPNNISEKENAFEGCTKLKKFYCNNPAEFKTWLTDNKDTLGFPNDIDECTFIQIE